VQDKYNLMAYSVDHRKMRRANTGFGYRSNLPWSFRVKAKRCFGESIFFSTVINLFVGREIRRPRVLHFCGENATNDPQCSSRASRGVPIASTATALCSDARVRYGLHIVPNERGVSYKTYKRIFLVSRKEAWKT